MLLLRVILLHHIKTQVNQIIKTSVRIQVILMYVYRYGHFYQKDKHENSIYPTPDVITATLVSYPEGQLATALGYYSVKN